MNTYDKTKIGRLIAWKGDHFVYDYDKDKEIKFSKFDFFMGYKKAREKSIKDYDTCKKFFGKYLLYTEVMTSTNGKYIALVQPRICGHFLRLKDLQDPLVRQQLKEILAGYYAMIKAGNAQVDLIGQAGAFSRCLSNIFVTEGNILVIFDATLIDMTGFSFWEKPFFYALFHFAKWRQDSDLKAFQKELLKYE